MQYPILTSYRSCTLKIDISCVRNTKVILNVCDAKMANTFFTRRFRFFTAGEKESFYVQMPMTGKAVVVTVYQEGMHPTSIPTDFSVTSITLLPLAKQMDVLPDVDGVRSFVPFAERFCFNAGVLSPYENRYYVSDRGGFKIKYSEVIKGEDGQDHVTPARIGVWDKVIEVARSKFLPMTIPMRLCVLFHEFSHLFVNKDMMNEVEADLNGLHIYLALGYPRIEAHETFESIFYSVQSDENIDRYERVKHFINKFEQLNFQYA